MPDRPWEDGESRSSKLVFIGKELDREELEAGFEACKVGAKAAPAGAAEAAPKSDYTVKKLHAKFFVFIG